MYLRALIDSYVSFFLLAVIVASMMWIYLWPVRQLFDYVYYVVSYLITAPLFQLWFFQIVTSSPRDTEHQFVIHLIPCANPDPLSTLPYVHPTMPPSPKLADIFRTINSKYSYVTDDIITVAMIWIYLLTTALWRVNICDALIQVSKSSISMTLHNTVDNKYIQIITTVIVPSVT